MPPSQKRSEPQSQTVIAGRYRLEEHRAQGGMAEVWRATDLQLSRTVAVKLLKPQLAADSTLAERFRREAIAAANLNHYNIVTVHDAIEYDGRQAVVMEFVDGKSLRELLDDNSQLQSSLVMHIGVSVCAALEAAHENGVIHRDVKPGNILLMKDGRVMLTDFGIAKVLGEGEDLTSENIMMGTAKYLSPEQVRGDTLDARADLYSLGIVLYECLVGRAPFVGKNDTETALARLQREPKNITSLRPSVNPQFAAVVHKLLARDPRQRFRTAADARLALSAVNAPPAREPEVVSRPVKDRTPPTGKVIRPKGHTPTGSPTPSTSTAKTGEARSTSASRSVPARSSILRTSSPSRLGIGLAALAVLVVGILISQSTGDDGAPAGPGVVTTDAVTTPLYTGPVEITGVKSHDPEGDDKAENEESVLLATDGDPSTIWTTSCYRSATFGSKSGVGLIVQLNAVALAQIEADVAGSSWKARVYTSAQAMETTAPTSQWGRPIWEGSSEGGSTLKATFTTPAQYALIFFTEVGRSGACSTKNPYRGGISEVRVSPAP